MKPTLTAAAALLLAAPAFAHYDGRLHLHDTSALGLQAFGAAVLVAAGLLALVQAQRRRATAKVKQRR